MTTRPWTPDRRNDDGSKTVTLKRCCNGCARELGDATIAELDAAVSGFLLPDVRDECGCSRTDQTPAKDLPWSEPGRIVTATFSRGDDMRDESCWAECECVCHDDPPLPAGTYVTVKLDRDASVGLMRVVVTELDNRVRDSHPAAEAGLERRYHVERIGGTPGKHDDCRYFVLDPQHDPHSVVALRAYAESARGELPELSADLHQWIAEVTR